MKFPDFTGDVTALHFDAEGIGSSNAQIEMVILNIGPNGEPGSTILSIGTMVTIATNNHEHGGQLDSPASVSNGFYAML